VYAGPPSGLGRVALGTLQQNESRRYRFTVTVPVSAGNAYQASSTTVSFAWTTAAVAGAPTPAPTPAPPPATAAAGPGVAPTATLTASAHQSGAKGSVAVSVACNVRCAAVVSGSALDGTTKIPLRAVRRAVLGRARLRIALPARAREALSQHRTLAVRLRLKATMGTTVVVARRTISVGSTRG
jgi:hypothetical protein